MRAQFTTYKTHPANVRISRFIKRHGLSNRQFLNLIGWQNEDSHDTCYQLCTNRKKLTGSAIRLFNILDSLDDLDLSIIFPIKFRQKSGLKSILKQKGFGTRELGRQVDYDYSNLFNIAKGKKLCHYELAKKISLVLNCSVLDLI